MSSKVSALTTKCYVSALTTKASAVATQPVWTGCASSANTEYSCKYRKTGFKLVNTGITKSYKWLRYSVSWYTGIAIPTTEAQLEFIETYNLEDMQAAARQLDALYDKEKEFRLQKEKELFELEALLQASYERKDILSSFISKFSTAKTFLNSLATSNKVLTGYNDTLK
ncbi:uncharacterized protein TNCV_1148591 [Trichonephila clavipes]|nr:uncharacterized protein TNCV_1148591 [Trichonephila clavipes]